MQSRPGNMRETGKPGTSLAVRKLEVKLFWWDEQCACRAVASEENPARKLGV
jgi:hypothetical protein